MDNENFNVTISFDDTNIVKWTDNHLIRMREMVIQASK